MLNNVRIAISGKSGCGNSTVTEIVGRKLNLRVINYTFHNMAREMGIQFDEFCELAEKDSKYDILVDQKQIALASEPGCILGSRLAIWLLKDADLKIYLHASHETRARRISQREGLEFDRALAKMVARDRRDRQRYIKLYEIDIDKYDFADLLIDTDHEDQFSVAELIIAKIRRLEE